MTKITFYQGRYLNDLNKKDLYIGEVLDSKDYYKAPKELIKIHSIFFKKPCRKQRAVLVLLISWAVKHYFKIIFKR
jgi:hypothetical protein